MNNFQRKFTSQNFKRITGCRPKEARCITKTEGEMSKSGVFSHETSAMEK